MQIPFNIPVDADAEWAILENIIRTILSERDAQTALQDEVVARMQQVWVDHQFSHTVTIPDDEQGQGMQAVLELHSAMKAHVTKLIFGRLLLEVELAQAKGLN
ncbi:MULTISPECIES: hypothetical protein [Oceanospirillaceae]|uniref:Uncharacterized protein n=1 Tax=Oceanobacter antarcticus TaxID=3133425 RepID=A0ABW8NE61_9GAMM